MQHPWPEECFVQGGSNGIVLAGKDTYTTAFVEAFPDETFLRGEGKTIAEAEDKCWTQYQKLVSCEHGPFEARGYKNGCGFCVKCGTWFPHEICQLPIDYDAYE
jgi:hypothetical protein